jgi:hypothetical protein
LQFKGISESQEKRPRMHFEGISRSPHTKKNKWKPSFSQKAGTTLILSTFFEIREKSKVEILSTQPSGYSWTHAPQLHKSLLLFAVFKYSYKEPFYLTSFPDFRSNPKQDCKCCNGIFILVSHPMDLDHPHSSWCVSI